MKIIGGEVKLTSTFSLTQGLMIFQEPGIYFCVKRLLVFSDKRSCWKRLWGNNRICKLLFICCLDLKLKTHQKQSILQVCILNRNKLVIYNELQWFPDYFYLYDPWYDYLNICICSVFINLTLDDHPGVAWEIKYNKSLWLNNYEIPNLVLRPWTTI